MPLLATCLHAQLPDRLFMEKFQEPVESAFTILKPRGWEVEGHKAVLR